MRPHFHVNKLKVFACLVAVIAILIAGSWFQLQRGLPALAISQDAGAANNEGSGDAPLVLPWPGIGQAAIAIDGAGLVGAKGDDRARPIASLVKVMTAYVILKDHPLRAGERGPEVQVQAADVDLYKQELANGESIVPVKQDAVLTELDLLQGLLIPSGNNLAYMLANWNSGSVEAFADRMNAEAATLGMKDSSYAEPSGVSPLSISTARDQLKLAQAAMSNPIFAAIVGAPQAQIPGVGVVYNVNSLVGKQNLVGIKTGWTEDAGACFLFAVDWPAGDHRVRIFGAVMGQTTLADAFAATQNLTAAMGPALQVVPVLSTDTPVASLKSRWGDQTSALPASNASVVVWPGLAVETQVSRTPGQTDAKKKAEVGKVVVTAGDQHQEVALIAQDSVPRAGPLWRLKRIW